MTANTLYCWIGKPRYSRAGNTAIVWGTTGSAAQTCGAAIYPDSDGATAVASGSVACPNSADAASVTGLTSYALIENTTYRFCICATNGQTYLGVSDTSNFDSGALLRAFTATAIGTAASGCSSGVPSGTAPALTASSTNLVPLMVVY